MSPEPTPDEGPSPSAGFPRRPPLGGLEKTIKGARHVGGLGRVLLPVLQREDFDKHLDYIIKNDPIVAAYIKRDPRYRSLLSETLREVYNTKYRPYLTGAKLIDSWDRITSSIGGLAELVPGAGHVVSEVEEAVELVPKVLYTALYAKGTNDYAFLPKAAAYEAASFIPYVGDVIDMKNLYVDRARETFRKRVADEFLNKVSPARSKTIQ